MPDLSEQGGIRKRVIAKSSFRRVEGAKEGADKRTSGFPFKNIEADKKKGR